MESKLARASVHTSRGSADALRRSKMCGMTILFVPGQLVREYAEIIRTQTYRCLTFAGVTKLDCCLGVGEWV